MDEMKPTSSPRLCTLASRIVALRVPAWRVDNDGRHMVSWRSPRAKNEPSLHGCAAAMAVADEDMATGSIKIIVTATAAKVGHDSPFGYCHRNISRSDDPVARHDQLLAATCVFRRAYDEKEEMRWGVVGVAESGES